MEENKKIDCTLCAFENPKVCVTAIPLKDNKVLVARRNEEPFKDQWDFIGGYVQKGEMPEDALKREIFEELNVKSALTYIGAFPGMASYRESTYPILSLAYLAELDGEIVLNHENSEVAWVPLIELADIAFDSNQKILSYLKEYFTLDVVQLHELIRQLDQSAQINEQSFYKAQLNGHVSIEKDAAGKIIGMGWIFPRQTLLRKQAVVEDMIVDEAYRGKGIGEKILTNLLEWAQKQGVEVVELTTNPKRIAANSLYQKMGFQLHITNHYLYKV